MLKTFGYQEQYVTVEQLSAIASQINRAIHQIGIREDMIPFMHGPNNSMGTLLSSFMEMSLAVIEKHGKRSLFSDSADERSETDDKIPSAEYNQM